MPVILNRWMLHVVLYSFIGTKYCMSQINMIFTALENMHPLHTFDFLEYVTENIIRLKIVTDKLI